MAKFHMFLLMFSRNSNSNALTKFEKCRMVLADGVENLLGPSFSGS